MSEFLQGSSNNDELLTINQIQIFLLLFADDTLLLSETKEGLQNLLDSLHRYCMKWNVTVNTEKTKVMVFKNGTRVEKVDFYYNNIRLDNVKNYTYLGVCLSSNGKFHQCQKYLAEQGSKALYALNTLFDCTSLNIKDKLKLFDSMILPILTYGSEIWGFHDSKDIERVHLKFLKQLLGVHSQTCNNAIYGELGRVPLSVSRKERILKYWCKLLNDRNCLLYKIYENEFAVFINHTGAMQNRNGCRSWLADVKDLLYNLGFAYLWDTQNITSLQIKAVVERLYDQYIQTWHSCVNDSPKLSTYRAIKRIFVIENYLQCIQNYNHRIALSRLRCSAHKLMIEEGRYRQIDRDNRLCICCNMKMVEDEYHFIMVCPAFRDLRNSLLPKYFST